MFFLIYHIAAVRERSLLQTSTSTNDQFELDACNYDILKDNCTFCLFKHEQTEHTEENCPNMEGMYCYNCLGPHFKNQCKNYINIHQYIRTQSKLLKSQKTCTLCLFAYDYGNHKSNSETCLKDKLKYICMQIFKSRYMKTQLCNHFGLERNIRCQDYYYWLLERKTHGATNAMKVFLWYKQTFSNFS